MDPEFVPLEIIVGLPKKNYQVSKIFYSKKLRKNHVIRTCRLTFTKKKYFTKNIKNISLFLFVLLRSNCNKRVGDKFVKILLKGTFSKGMKHIQWKIMGRNEKNAKKTDNLIHKDCCFVCEFLLQWYFFRMSTKLTLKR